MSTNAMDVFPTLSAVLGIPLPQDRVYDGENLMPLLKGKPLKRPDGQPFYYYNCENLQAIRRGQWKLHLPREKELLPFWDKNKEFANLQNPVLYDLSTDAAETTDVASDNPGVVNELMELGDAIRQNLGEFMRPGRQQRPTGSLFPGTPVISHEKDWGMLDQRTIEGIAMEREKRHPNHGAKKPRPKRKKQK